MAGASASSLASPLVDKKGLSAILADFVESTKFDTDLKALTDSTKVDKAAGDGKFEALEATTAALQATMLEQIKMPSMEAEFAEYRSAGALSGLAKIREFKTPGRSTYTKPAGVQYVRVFVTGGGAGGGSHNGDDAQGGGGAGATCIKLVDVRKVASIAMTIGTGGHGASGNRATGGWRGSKSVFGSYCTADVRASGDEIFHGWGGFL